MLCRRYTRFLLFSTSLWILTLTSVQAETLFRWVDKDGTVRYGDVLPNEQVGKEYQVLSPDGRVIKNQQAAKSPEEIRKQRADLRRKQREARIQEEINARMAAMQEHHDNVLLMTYTNEKEIEIAKDERLEVINSVIQLLRKNISTEKEKLAREEKIAKQLYTDKGLPIPGGQAQKIEYFTEKVLAKQLHLNQKLDERAKIKQQYQKDVLRYRQLMARQQREREAREKARLEAEERALYE